MAMRLQGWLVDRSSEASFLLLPFLPSLRPGQSGMAVIETMAELDTASGGFFSPSASQLLVAFGPREARVPRSAR